MDVNAARAQRRTRYAFSPAAAQALERDGLVVVRDETVLLPAEAVVSR